VTFATGTPISNSMTELYTNMRYLQYGTLQKLGLVPFAIVVPPIVIQLFPILSVQNLNQWSFQLLQLRLKEFPQNQNHLCHHTI